jgi:hypothetical protein
VQQRGGGEEGSSHPSLLLAATSANGVFTDMAIEGLWFLPPQVQGSGYLRIARERSVAVILGPGSRTDEVN